MERNKRLLAMLLVLMMILVSTVTSYGASVTPEAAMKDTGEYIYKTVTNPIVESIGGEWAVIGLARSGMTISNDYYNKYYANLENTLKETKGVLHDKKYTEYSRVVLALKAIGKDPSNVAGYNLLDKLADFDKVIWQGINGPIFALLALDSGNYGTTEYKDKLIGEILKNEIKGGGFSLTGTMADVDITGMALQALAPYKDRSNVKPVVDRALEVISTLQKSDGNFKSFGQDNVEALSQVLVALCGLGINPETDSRFIKNNNSVVDSLMSYYVPNTGFKHTVDGQGNNQMSTEQAYYALVALDRFKNGKSSLYQMNDVKDNSDKNKIEGISITIDGKAVTFDENSGSPFLDNAQRTQVPLRVTMESYGATVNWDNDVRAVIVEKDNVKVEVPIGEKYILKNKVKVEIDTEAQIKNERTYLPIRAVVEALGGKVDWNDETKTVIIEK